MKEEIEKNQPELSGFGPLQVLQWVVKNIDRPVFASSLGQEDQVILHLIAAHRLPIPVITLDTGRLFPETYDLIAETESRLSVKIRILFPDAAEVETMVAEEGINLFLKGVDQRKRCCQVRKINPLRRVLRESGGWICGLRQEQSSTRSELKVIEWDEANKVPKINPLYNWSLAQVVAYLKENGVPYNPLHDQGFISIGCACCTRAVQPGEDIRSGRWWWETPEQKECGLHLVNGKFVRSKDLEKSHE
ncbi:MAG: phosphoadenylyl-sulfate reductase [Kiritimatiellaceae bacterium]|nr:phosphoadenylyl-sulfate reductase [Kiritimatiellaceae bacterium]